MLKISLKRIIKFGLESISRNKGLFLANVFIIVIATSFIGGLFFLRGFTDSLVASLQEKVNISVYFNINTQESDILKIKDQISQIPEVKQVDYISRDQALATFQEEHKDNPLIAESIQEIGDNPLDAVLNIKAWQASQYEQISNFLSSSQFKDLIDKINYNQNKDLIDRLFSITFTIEKISFLFIVISVILAILVVFNTVRLGIFNFKDEISIMRLVGASNWFIRGPFMIEGIISAFLATVFSIIFFAFIFLILTPKVAILIPDFNLFEYFKTNLGSVFLIQLTSALSLSIIPSLIAIRRHLKV